MTVEVPGTKILDVETIVVSLAVDRLLETFDDVQSAWLNYVELNSSTDRCFSVFDTTC